MDLQERLDELAILIEDAKAMPLSASCIVNRTQVLDLIDEIRHLLPESVQRADQVLADRDAFVIDGRREAERLIARARAEAQRMLSEHEVYQAAVAEAQALRAEALQETSQMRQETDDYVDAKLASFEIVLQKTLRSVDRGRERLRSQMYDELAPHADEPLTEEIFLDERADDTGAFDVIREEPRRVAARREDWQEPAPDRRRGRR
ncbi:MAG: ATPase [Actinomycetales bacterium]|nr:ATPase [Actinomycetales bacterium]